jgi:hypothetical protein
MPDDDPFQCAFHEVTGICGTTLVFLVAVVAMALGLVIPGLALLLALTMHKLSAL